MSCGSCSSASTSCAMRCSRGSASTRSAARLPHLRAHARAVAALPSRAPHRRPVAHHRARHQGHRDDRPLHHAGDGADHPRIRADGRRSSPSPMAGSMSPSSPSPSGSTSGSPSRSSDWRITIRREMNDCDTDANTKAIDSLLNYETVKYFGNETMEAERFDRSMARYERAATRTWTSLGWLNFGQGVIFGVGMTIVMCAVGARGDGRHADRRRFRLRQRHADAAFAAAQLHRHDLSRDPPGPDRHREDVRPARRQPARWSTGPAPCRWP